MDDLKFRVGDVVRITQISYLRYNHIGQIIDIIDERDRRFKNCYKIYFLKDKMIDNEWRDEELEKLNDREAVAWLI